jgi:hypothetical protein
VVLGIEAKTLHTKHTFYHTSLNPLSFFHYLHSVSLFPLFQESSPDLKVASPILGLFFFFPRKDISYQDTKARDLWLLFSTFCSLTLLSRSDKDMFWLNSRKEKRKESIRKLKRIC